MRKKIICLVMMIALLAVPTTTKANGSDKWYVDFNGSRINSSFKNTDIEDAVYQLQPGDTVKLQIALNNDSDKETSWYMNNKVIKSLEDSKDGANGGAYSYILTYIAPDNNTSTVLYSSESVGGEDTTGGVGLNQVPDALKDYFFLDTLEKNESAKITLEVKLEGETQGNGYQDTLAELQMNFAVEPAPDPIIKTNVINKVIHTFRNNIVKTGDTTNILLYSVLALAAGVICLIIVVIRVKRSRAAVNGEGTDHSHDRKETK